ncbi:MAG: flagellar basal body rod protein FlgC [Candidatus Margulisiibacteriota bacterium]
MSLDRALEISKSGIDTQAEIAEIIASNLANMNTTRTVFGEPYRRLIPVVESNSISFNQYLEHAKSKYSSGGVRISNIMEDRTAFRKVYDPGHPDADTQGFVLYPNVDQAKEQIEQIANSKFYEANIVAYNSTKGMLRQALEIQ